MKNQSDWDTFYRSGRVEDYLIFCQNRDKCENVDADRGLEEKHAEFYGGFRSGAESGTHRGV
ncbi:MAG: hypothetical protein E7284_05490 [Lachnospiraceae bacterium]|nr:hypothetical protein [Lachnospiraceae bacterium]